MVYQDSDPDVRRVRYEVHQFKTHMMTYLAVVGVLFLATVVSGGWPGGSWFAFWVVFIWGLVVAIQGARLFGDHMSREWEERMVQHIVERRRAAASRPQTPPPGPIVTPPPPRAEPPGGTAMPDAPMA